MELKLQDYLHYYLHGQIWEVGVSACTLMGIGDKEMYERWVITRMKKKGGK